MVRKKTQDSEKKSRKQRDLRVLLKRPGATISIEAPVVIEWERSIVEFVETASVDSFSEFKICVGEDVHDFRHAANKYKVAFL